MQARKRLAIYGGSGYGTSELLRILAGHPGLEAAAVVSSSKAGERVDSVHRHMSGICELDFTAEVGFDPSRYDAIVFALPHKKAASLAPRLLAEHPKLKAVDLSGDFRLRKPEDYARWYGGAHPEPAWLGSFVYGQPEFHADAVAKANYVANPGCFATGLYLALAPFVRAGLAGARVAVAGATGSSGSGAEPAAGTHHPERTENFRAYKPLEHQHVGEVIQALAAQGTPPVLDFVPHSAPLSRGIYATAFIYPGRELDAEEAREVLVEAYRGKPFVRVLKQAPTLGPVLRTNFCDVWATGKDGCITVIAALDNLVKGMAGQAVQNLNLMFGLPETAGLRTPGFRP